MTLFISVKSPVIHSLMISCWLILTELDNTQLLRQMTCPDKLTLILEVLCDKDWMDLLWPTFIFTRALTLFISVKSPVVHSLMISCWLILTDLDNTQLVRQMTCPDKLTLILEVFCDKDWMDLLWPTFILTRALTLFIAVKSPVIHSLMISCRLILTDLDNTQLVSAGTG